MQIFLLLAKHKALPKLIILFFSIAFSVSTLSQTITRGPYLQEGDSDSMIVQWRTSSATNSVVNFGTSANNLSSVASDASPTTNHVVELTGLNPATRYFYSVGHSGGTIASGADYYFETSPVRGTAYGTRIWVIGDSGTANSNAADVYNAYRNYTGSTYTNLWLMLGDNAYNDGTDSQYQAAVFDMYPELLRQTPLWSTLGNHDGYTADSETQSGPYYDIFNFPTNAEVGGVASGTEAYYSFDYANIHFVVLDSYETSRSTDGAMMNWLEDDLQNVTADWLIAVWHHPPYTKGSHNSDIELALIQMRQNFLPVLESYGVDLVLNGHSHSYERSKFINGHYGFSGTYSNAFEIDGGSGRIDGSGAYEKDGNSANSGAVYAVAGASGKTSGGSLNHPAMFISLNQLGSMVLDINNDTLDAKYVNNNGAITDYFTISKSTTAPTPPAAPSNLSASATSSQSVALSWTDNANNEVGFDIERSLDNNAWVLAGSVGMNTSDYTDLGLTSDTQYFFRVRAKNSGGTSAYSNIITVTTFPSTPIETTTFQNGLNDYSGTQDTYIASGTADSNWGNTQELLADGADGGNGELVTFVKWDISSIPDSAAITAAEMSFELFNTSPGAYNVFAADLEWSESNITWNSANMGNMQGTLLGTLFPSDAGKLTLVLNSTGAARVQEWVHGTTVNNGFLIRSAGTGDGIDMRSSEYSTVEQRPSLSVTYETGVVSNAPSAPSSLSANAVSEESIAITWVDNADNETRFNIERSLDGSNWSPITTVTTNTTSFTDSGLAADTTYFYRVSASNNAGTSAFSNIASAVTEPGEPSDTLILQNGLNGYSGTQDSYIASGAAGSNWGSAANVNADGDDPGNGELVALFKWDVDDLPNNARVTVVDIHLEVFNTSPGEYRIYAMNGAWTENNVNWSNANINTQQGQQLGVMLPNISGDYTLGLNADGVALVQAWADGTAINNGILLRSSGTNDGVDIRSSEYSVTQMRPSMTITYTIDDPLQPPNAPSDLQAFALSGSSIDISWDHERTDDETSIVVERSLNGSGWTALATLQQDFDQYTDSGLESNTRYSYRVKAFNSAGSSNYSNTATATTENTITTSVFQQGLNGYSGAADTYIASWRRNNNYGGQTQFEADGWDGWNGELVGLMKWDISSIHSNAQLLSASITLEITDSTNNTYGFYHMLNSWGESSATWNNTAIDNGQSILVSAITPTSNGSYTANFTEEGLTMLNTWISNPGANHGVVLRSMGTLNGIIVSAKENGNLNVRPKLTIEYQH